jgi:hypothetical protein
VLLSWAFLGFVSETELSVLYNVSSMHRKRSESSIKHIRGIAKAMLLAHGVCGSLLSKHGIVGQGQARISDRRMTYQNEQEEES